MGTGRGGWRLWGSGWFGSFPLPVVHNRVPSAKVLKPHDGPGLSHTSFILTQDRVLQEELREGGVGGELGFEKGRVGSLQKKGQDAS